MYGIKKILLVVGLVTVAGAQSAQPPLSDNRFTVHTLVREDIFAGFLFDDMERFARGEKNIELLLEQRPAQKANLLSWKGGAALYRAVRAHESNQPDEFKRYYRQALDSFAEAARLNGGNDGVAAVTGGSFAVFADRLPKEHRASAWSAAYENYQALYKQQAPIVDRLPVHLRGEMLSGLAQSAQRTGRKEEAAQHIDKILAVLADTPYEPMAKKWKANPESAATTSLTCMNCHDAGRLSARITALSK
jgi:tetratricopeptide (TPR) repeat protein